ALGVHADPAERIAFNEELGRVALAGGDRRAALRADLLQTLACWELGDAAGAMAHARAYAARSAEQRHGRSLHCVVAHLEATQPWWAGGCDEAARRYGEADELARGDEARGIAGHAFRLGWWRAADRRGEVVEIEAELRLGLGAIPHELGGCITEMLVAQLNG